MKEDIREDAKYDFWETVFGSVEVYNRREILTRDEFDKALKSWNDELTEEEKETLKQYMLLNEINESSNYFKNKKLPMSYINFLKFCNIREMVNGERYFQFLSLEETRGYSIAYMFPKWMNGGITFAMDGAGNHYVFDMRKESVQGEYPIYAVSSGSQGWDDDEAFFLGNSFLEVVTAKTNIEDIMFEDEEEESFYSLVDIELVKLPSGGSVELYMLLGDLGLACSPKIIMEYQKSPLPRIIAENKLWREIEPRMSKLKDPSIVRIIYKEE